MALVCELEMAFSVTTFEMLLIWLGHTSEVSAVIQVEHATSRWIDHSLKYKIRFPYPKAHSVLNSDLASSLSEQDGQLFCKTKVAYERRLATLILLSRTM